jgi:hypothetical protein
MMLPEEEEPVALEVLVQMDLQHRHLLLQPEVVLVE